MPETFICAVKLRKPVLIYSISQLHSFLHKGPFKSLGYLAIKMRQQKDKENPTSLHSLAPSRSTYCVPAMGKALRV